LEIKFCVYRGESIGGFGLGFVSGLFFGAPFAMSTRLG
jgi:hypothetical protein